MYILYLYLFISFISHVLSSCCIELKETGTDTMTPGDVGMVLWINLKNICDEKFHISVKMIRCTENIGEGEQETNGMYLIGGYMGIIHAKSVLKATLIYPNMYLYNRQGVCSISIRYTDDHHQTRSIRGKIRFNTNPQDGVPPPEIIKFFKTIKTHRPCDTPDLDPLEGCTPVDCMMKYLGVRNYYNERWKRCQKVPACVSDGLKDDPDVAYIPTSNRCRNLANCITENDISLLEEGYVSNDSVKAFSSRGLLLKCNNGRLDNNTGICKCKEGYMSVESDIENYIPGLTVYYMCNIKVDTWNKANLPKLKSTILGFATLAVVIVMLILLLTFCCYGVYAYIKTYEDQSPFGSSTSSDMDFDECDRAVQYDMNRMMRYCS